MVFCALHLIKLLQESNKMMCMKILCQTKCTLHIPEVMMISQLGEYNLYGKSQRCSLVPLSSGCGENQAITSPIHQEYKKI